MVNSDVSPLMNDSRRIIASANKQGPILFRLNDVQRKRDGRGQERRGRLFPLLAFLAIQEKKLTIFDSNGARGRKGSDNEGVVTKGGDKGWWSDSGANDREDTEFFLSGVDFITNVVFEGVRFSCKVFWNYYGSEREGRRERENFERIFVKEIC